MTNDDADQPPTSSKSRILVCDDSKLVRLTANKILAEKFDLVLAEDGEDGWQKISTDNTIQVVFTDLGMPNLDGFGLIQRVRTSEDESIRNLPIIVITGANDNEDVKRKIFEIGATDFITKPFKATTIIARAEAHTSYRNANSALQENVNIDTLTGILNRKGLDQRLDKDMSFVNRHSENIAVTILELDDFDQIYDRIGQATSDAIIKQVAKTLSGAVRKEDSIGRDGLAKFIISFPMAKSESVIKLSKRVCTVINSFKLKVGGQALALTASVGIATVGKGQQADANAIIQCAEQALTNAKALGKGEVQFLKLEVDETEEADEAISIDALLEQIRQGEFLDNMDAVVDRLAPLVALMSADQRKALLT